MKEKKRKILIVEKDRDLRKMMHLNLRQEGRYDVTALPNADNIIGMVKEFKPDVIILSLLMHTQNYIKACELLYNDEASREIPVIVLDALNRDKSKVCIMSIVDYLVKPVDTDSLTAAIERALSLKRD